jgi:hypothetical protein
MKNRRGDGFGGSLHRIYMSSKIILIKNEFGTVIESASVSSVNVEWSFEKTLYVTSH